MTRSGSLQALVEQTPDLVEHFVNDTRSLHMRAAPPSAAAVPPVFTNWRDEQRAWRETAALFDQSHHMPELFIKGPDAKRLLESLAINSFGNFTTARAKQFVACAPDGHVIGDCIAYRHADDQFELISGMTVLNWVQFQAERRGADVEITRDHPTAINPTGRRVKWRFQLEGPNAAAILGEVVTGEVPKLPFFHTANVEIAGCPVLILRHGMAGHLGTELSGPYEDMETVREAILAAGAKHGLERAGSRTYFSTLVESGWMAYPCPAIYTGEEMREFREWLPGDGWEASLQIGGSYRAPSIEDYYMSPWELGYGRFIKFDHDFVGREALERSDATRQRVPMTLVWDTDDVTRIYRSQFGDGPVYKQIELPVADYGFPQADEVHDAAGEHVGLSFQCGYTVNEAVVLSLAALDAEHARPGTEVELTWGEPHGGSRKPHVERHEQTTIHATVASIPYAETVRRLRDSTLSTSATGAVS
uniref:aminomethyltransferase family protein n=1 Tax=Nocardia vaccinii TaxID=1822 RepID=UPI00082D912B